MPRPAQLPLDLPHRPSLARDDLIVTDANRLAVSAIDSWPSWQHPVLLIVGPPGSGKSHLAAAWAEMSGATALAGDTAAAPFTLVIDDIDRAPLDETVIFGAVNAARLGGGFVLATARAHPAEMKLSLADLRSRLQAATLVETGRPDDALLIGVLSKLFADRQIAIDPKLVHYLSLRMERSLEQASRLVAAVDHEALASKEKVSRALLQRVLERSGLRPQAERVTASALWEESQAPRAADDITSGSQPPQED
ncbi:hypothetical protein Sa4125_13430 [Aureimonas sp. SA4125]|uniref:hypothetical protein n=1 Tax=Aureimonas sp. SA4125 TaxID=2826993 RepID=UPI001CC5D62E|nr:hypothetical protein [Aureimonas sp. SA4125]BDA83801.1 hypothetical protein Sa4125_13430 [Aureimonas sp. SA4125]